MRNLTAKDLIRAINTLDKNIVYSYVNERNHGEIQIENIVMPEGPIRIKRRKKIGDTWKSVNISSEMIWRIANALNSRLPINVDRILAGSYNTRSALEALLAHTPEIYYCTPGRLENIGNKVKIKPGHKHILWDDKTAHQLGEICKKNLGDDFIISEIPSVDVMYDVIPARIDPKIDIMLQRRHSQMQIALAEIASALSMRTWLAVQDHGIKYNGKVITEYPFIIKDLSKENVFTSYPNALKVAKNIDCMYINGGLPFAFEVEHTTGVVTGLDRMLKFKNAAPHLNTQCVIVAPDEQRKKVFENSSAEHFKDLNTLYFPYSQVEELYSFLSRHKNPKGIKKDFLLTFMEAC